MNHKFSPQQQTCTALGQSQFSPSVDFPDFSGDPLGAARGIIWAVIFMSPFWMLVILFFFYFMK